MAFYKANDKYSAVLTAGYTVGQSTLYVSAVPEKVPTIIVAAKGTDKETVFGVTGKTTNSLTGVSRLRGANVDLDAQTPLTCLNNEEFINQFGDAFLGEHAQDGTHNATKVGMLAGEQNFTGQKTFSGGIKTDTIAEATSGAKTTISNGVKTDTIDEKTADVGVTIDGLLIKDSTLQTANAVTALSQISGGVIQVVVSSNLGQISATNQNTETHWGQVAITPKRSDSAIYVFLAANGLDNGGSGRLHIRLRHDTTSGGTTGTEISSTQVAQDSAGSNGVSSVFLLGSVSPGNTTTRYFKATATKYDTSTTWYCGEYSASSYILLVEVRA